MTHHRMSAASSLQSSTAVRSLSLPVLLVVLATGLGLLLMPGCAQTQSATNNADSDTEEDADTMNPPADNIYSIVVPLPIAEIEARLTAAAKERKYGVLGSRNLTELLREKGQEPVRDMIVFDVCNPAHANTVLTADPRIASVLPCRIAAYAEFGATETTLVFVKPTLLLDAFGQDDLEPTAVEVNAAMIEIVDSLLHPATSDGDGDG